LLNEYVVNYPIVLFDREFKQSATYIYSGCFNTGNNFSIIESEDFRVLVLKTKSKPGVKARALSSFLNAAIRYQIEETLGDEKTYGDLCKRFKERLSLDGPVLRPIVAS